MKKHAIAIAVGLLVCGLGGGLAAATVTVDRPSPPPCCADGVCYPKVNTWGYYQGRWRRWPGELRPTAITPTPAEQVPGIPPFQTPSPQEEDRPAPRRTQPVEQPTPPPAAPPEGAPPAETPPAGTPEQPEPEAPRMPWEQHEATGEWDPPPTLPFGPAVPGPRPAVRSAARPVGPQVDTSNDLPLRTSASDAPPPLPLALSRATW